MGRSSGLYSALVCSVYSLHDDTAIADLDSDLNDIVSSNQQDAVVSIVMFPTRYINTRADSKHGLVVGYAPRQHTQEVGAPSTIGSYTPRNKKLLTYPYVFMTVDTLNSSHDYKYEYFDNRNEIAFAEIGCISPNPEIVVMPVDYNGTDVNLANNATESVSCTGFPQCAFVIDSYRAWVAQKSVDFQLSQAQTVFKELGAVTNIMNPSAVISAGQYPLQMERDSNASMIEQTAGSKVRGNTGASADVASRAKGIYYKYMGITEEFAKRIDDFFDRFGYSCGRIKVPNRNVRPHWTYTKTVDVAIRGNVPVDDMRKIKNIYNNGITFWKYGSEVGNYSLNNSV